jgi:hypothetical protein
LVSRDDFGGFVAFCLCTFFVLEDLVVEDVERLTVVSRVFCGCAELTGTAEVCALLVVAEADGVADEDGGRSLTGVPVPSPWPSTAPTSRPAAAARTNPAAATRRESGWRGEVTTSTSQRGCSVGRHLACPAGGMD